MTTSSPGKIPDQGPKKKKPADPGKELSENDEHLGSSNAFEETENPASSDPDDISDEKLDEWLSE